MRRGFWNRRGDHLTSDGYVVYAPAAVAYPSELAGYPDEKVGYQDHEGMFTAFLARPELPQSLPRSGMEPDYPYEAVCFGFLPVFFLKERKNEN